MNNFHFLFFTSMLLIVLSIISDSIPMAIGGFSFMFSSTVLFVADEFRKPKEESSKNEKKSQ